MSSLLSEEKKPESKMVNQIPLGFLLALLLPLIFSQAQPLDSIRPTNPLPLLSLRIKPNQTASSCSYTVAITTSCSSPSYTRDSVSLSFGDAYGNQVNVPRLDDPSSGTFERCSTDTFQIYGPCTYDVCYAYLLRRGSDGWKVGSMQIYGTYSRTVTFKYNDYLPNNVWWGFNYCSGSSSQGFKKPQLSLTAVNLVVLLLVMLEWNLGY